MVIVVVVAQLRARCSFAAATLLRVVHMPLATGGSGRTSCDTACAARVLLSWWCHTLCMRPVRRTSLPPFAPPHKPALCKAPPVCCSSVPHLVCEQRASCVLTHSASIQG